VFLSGGVDSALVAALAARSSSAPVETFTVGYDEGSVNETGAARRTAELIGAEHEDLILSSDEAAGRAVQVLAALDQPIADQALVALHAVAEFARRDVTVAVGGEGADELFGGYPRYRWLARAEELSRRVPSPVLKAGATAVRRLPSRYRASRLAGVLDPVPGIERHIDWVTDGRRHLREKLYGPALTPVAARNGRVRETFDALSRAPAAADEGSRIAELFMRLDLHHWLPDDVLAKADRATMLVSLEMRTPYLHREIAELAAVSPIENHLRGGGKALIRELLQRVLPDADFKRDKTAFRVPAAEWLRGPLAPELRRLRAGALCEEGWFDGDAIGELVDDHVEGRRDVTSVLWPALSFGLWLERFRANG
jgi:asparagine synthase (glutamine-hydrolysing)